MKKIYLSLILSAASILSLTITDANAQCTKSAFQTSNVGAPPCGGNYAQTNVGSGAYISMSVVAGAQYCISTCGSTWNTQLTGFNGNTAVFFNNDNGFDCNPSQQASIQWTATFTGTLDVQVNLNNCQGYQGGGSVNSAILKYKQCTPTITSSGADLCPGQSVTLTADQPGGTWSVSPNNGSFVPPNTFTPTAVGAYTITYTLAACSPTQVINVITPSVPPTAAIASPSSLCPGGTATLSVSGGSLGGGATWQWYSGSCGGTSVGSGTSITVSPSSTTTYYVRAEGGCGPTSCASVTVPVNNLSTAPTSVTASNTTLCAGTSTTLTVNGGSLGTGSSWFWYNGSCGGILVGSGTTITINPLSSTTYYVRAEGPCNVTTCATVTINVTPAPQAGFSFITTPSACGASDGCIGMAVNGGTPPYSYTYNGQPGTDTYCNIPAGPYIIVVTDANGCQDVTSVSLNDPGATPATIASSDPDNTICQGESVTFTASGSYLYNYYVNGNFVTTANPWTTTSLNNGDIVNVVALDYNFCSFTTLGITMTVHPNPVVTVTSTDPSACGATDGSVIANVSGGQPSYNFAWSPNTSETTSTAFNLSAGAYFVTVSDQNGCSAVGVAALSDPGASPVTLTSSDVDSTICSNENVDFTATGSLDYTFSSSVNGVVLGPSTVNIYSTTGLVNNEIIIVAGTDVNGCTATSNYITTTVNPGPTVTLVSSDQNDSICVGELVTFTGTGALFYQFFINGVSQGPPGTNNVIQSSTLANGDVIYVEGTDANHCIVASNSITMTVSNPPVVSVTLHQDPSDCGASDGLIIVAGTGGAAPYTYVWNGNPNPPFDQPNLVNLYAGPYHVEVTDASGCSGDTTVALSDVGSSPVFISSSDNDGVICEGESVTFTGSGATTYVFYIDGQVVSTNNPFTTTNLQDGQSIAVVGLDTLLCAATSSVIDFVVNPAPHIFIGTVTNPSGCGLSDGSILTNTFGGVLPYSYTWNNGPPNAPDNTNIPAGPYTVEVTDVNGCKDQASVSLNDIGAPLVTITSSDPDLFICQHDTVTFTGGNGALTYNFYVNGPPAIPGLPDTYTTSTLANNDVVAVTGTDNLGCTGTSQTLTFTVIPVVVPTLSTFADVCENVDQLMLPGLAGESPAGGTFTAYYNGISITSDLFFPYGIGDGTHPITYSYDNGFGCTTTATADITVLPSPVVDLGPAFATCDSSLLVAPPGYVDYHWFPEPNLPQTADNDSLIIFNSAIYSVTVTDNAGCIGVGQVEATINHAPNLEINVVPTGNPTEICIGDTVTLCITTPTGTWSYIEWSTNSFNTECIDVYQTGNYSVLATDFNGCSDTIYPGQGVVVTVHDPQPIVTVLVNEFTTSGEFINYQWFFNGSPVAVNGNNQTFHAGESGNYYVEVTDQWGCVGQSAIIEHTYISPDGIDENGLNYTLDIFPNPTNGVFTVNAAFETAVDIRLELTNVLGQPVIQVEDIENAQNVRRDYNMNHLAQGVYIFTIRTDGQTIVRRVVKN